MGRAEKVARLTKSSVDGHQIIKLSTRNTIFSPTGTPTLTKSVRLNPHRASDLRPHSLLSALVTEMAGWARWLACRLLKRRHQRVSGGTRHTCTASCHACLAAFGYPRVLAQSKGCFVAPRPSAVLFFSRSEAFYGSMWLYLLFLLWYGMVVFTILKNRFSESA